MSQAVRRNPTDGAPEDADLVRAAQGGDQAAFTELVRRYQRAVYRVAWALTRNSSDADDVAQETFVRAYQALGRFRVGEPLYPWLARIATNLAFSMFRSRKRRPETPLEPLLEAGQQWGVDDDPSEKVTANEQSQHLQEAFAGLKPEHQTILTLRVVEEQSYDAIAHTLGVPIGTVMSRLSRGRALLQRALGTKPAQEDASGL
jgi:RNA polymerase sigma-70 factor (ECF subfamily)